MLLVVSPAKNLDLDSPVPSLRTTRPALLDDTRQLATRLKGMSPDELSGLMHISANLAQLNHERFTAWQPPFTRTNARPALLMFAGDVYQGMAAQSFTGEDFTFAQHHLRILSGFYGILRPLDLIQPYRLEMGARLQTARGKDLYSFWGDRITGQINDLVRKRRASALVNLASQEYFKSINTGLLDVPVIEPVFKDYKNGNYKIISFFAKKARGLMSGYVIRNHLTDPEALKQFTGEGYRFCQAQSSATKWIFIRKQ